MGWYPNNDGRDMGPSLDRWITGNYGEDQRTEESCNDCNHRRYDDTCLCPQSDSFLEKVADDDTCDKFESPNRAEEEPADLDERRDNDD